MSDTKTIIDKALTHEIVTNVIEEQSANMTQSSVPAAMKAMGSELAPFARQAAQAVLCGSVSAPDLSAADWKRDFANAVEKAMMDADIEALIGAFHAKALATGLLAESLHDSPSFVVFSFFKVAQRIGQVSWMIRHGLDPELLRMSEEEADAHLTKIAAAVRETGATMAVLVPRPHQR